MCEERLVVVCTLIEIDTVCVFLCISLCLCAKRVCVFWKPAFDNPETETHSETHTCTHTTSAHAHTHTSAHNTRANQTHLRKHITNPSTVRCTHALSKEQGQERARNTGAIQCVSVFAGEPRMSCALEIDRRLFVC